MAQRPIVTPPSTTARAPIAPPSRTMTPFAAQSSARLSRPSLVTERGYESLVSTAAGPTKLPSSSRAGAYTKSVVLQLDVVAEHDALVDVRTPPDDAVAADCRV